MPSDPPVVKTSVGSRLYFLNKPDFLGDDQHRLIGAGRGVGDVDLAQLGVGGGRKGKD